jgi:transcription elongation GreA/GreB family factor
MPAPDKTRILQALRDELEQRLRTLQDSAAATYAAATHEEARAEDKYDTRSLELSYLTAGQDARILELRQTLTSLHFFTPPVTPAAVEPGTLVLVDNNGRTQRYLLLPMRVGERLVVDGCEIQVVGTAAPVGQALLGRQVGDIAQVRAAGTVREVEVLEVQ